MAKTKAKKCRVSSTVSPSEIAKFEAMADEWWDLGGKFRPLHLFNPVRIRFIRDAICQQHHRSVTDPLPLAGLEILDIGCGGGLLAEPLARLGARVTAIDASEKNIKVAQIHAKKVGLSIDYRATTAEALAESGRKFDAVLAMEIVEHVADVDAFLGQVAALAKKNGLIFVATLNRTARSFLFAIVGAEYVLGWLPRGTHDWKRFLRPSEIALGLEQQGAKLMEITGVEYRPFRGDFTLGPDTSVNYILKAKKTR